MQTAKHEPGEPRFRVPRNARTGIIATVSTVICATSLFAIPAASAAVPAFPDNLVVFPDRDFVTIEGYQDHIGETATVEVRRSGAGVIGSAKGVVQAGDVAFEINHPGGYCWGAGTGLNITPDIRPGDTVSIKFDAQLRHGWWRNQSPGPVRHRGLRPERQHPDGQGAHRQRRQPGAAGTAHHRARPEGYCRRAEGYPGDSRTPDPGTQGRLPVKPGIRHRRRRDLHGDLCLC